MYKRQIYGPLSQYDYAQNILFRNKNTPESIMEIQHTYTQGGLTYTCLLYTSIDKWTTATKSPYVSNFYDPSDHRPILVDFELK